MPAAKTAKKTAARATAARKSSTANGRTTPAKRAAAITKATSSSPSAHALVASGRRINLSAKRLAPVKTKDWQDECWLYFDEVTEIKESIWYLGNQMAKLMLYVGLGDARGDVVDVNDPNVLNPDNPDANPVVVPASVAAAAAEALAGVQCLDGGQAELLRRTEMNLEVAGELYLIGFAERPVGSPGYPDGEPADWQVCSTDEIELKGKSYIVKSESGDTKGRPVVEDEGDVMIRVWLGHPRWKSQPDSLLRGTLPDCRLLSAIVGQQLAEAYSKLNAGFFTWPKELNPKQNITAEPNGDGEPKQNPTLEKLIDGLVGPVEDTSHPASVTPTFIEGQAEYLTEQYLRHISIARPSDPTIDDRKEKSIERVARGMNLPVEKVMGHEETTFANAAQVDEDEFDDYLKPRADMLTTILTTLVMRPIWRALPEVGEEWADRLVVAGDPSAMIATPNVEDNANDAFDRNTISAETYRKVKGYREEDAPDDDEVLARLAQRRGILTADISKALLEQGMGVSIDVQALPAPAPTGQPAGGDVAAAAEIITQLTAAARKPLTGNVGRQLQQIDYELRVRVLVAADMALSRAMEKAGNRLRSRLTASAKREFRTVSSKNLASMLGPSLVADIAGADDLFAGAWDDLERSFTTWAAEAGSQAIDVAGRVTSGFSIAEREALQLRQADSVAEAWQWLKGSLQSVGEAKLFDPNPNVPLEQIGESLSTQVPPGMIRQAISRAGGSTGLVTQQGGAWIVLADGGTRPAGGIGTGELIRDALRDNGAGQEGYAWVYGPALRKTPFLPHQELDGVTFVNFDDDVLANTSGFPEVDFYFPGDHDGCVCDFEPIIIPADQNPQSLAADETDLDVVPPMVVNDLGPMPTGLKSSRAIEDEFAKRWGNGGERLTSLKWMTRDSAESVAVRLDKMMTLHPQTAESIVGVGKPGADMAAIGHRKPIRGAIAVAEGRFPMVAGRPSGEVTTAIKFNSKYFTKAGEDALIDQYEVGSTTKFFAPGGSEDPAAYIVTHEFGHAIDYKATANATKMGLSERAYTNELDAVVERHLGPARDRAATGKTMETVLSRYGGTNRAEMIAESIAEYHMSDNPRAFAREIYEIVFKYAEGGTLPSPLGVE
jgi:hypothetical protein